MLAQSHTLATPRCRLCAVARRRAQACPSRSPLLSARSRGTIPPKECSANVVIAYLISSRVYVISSPKGCLAQGAAFTPTIVGAGNLVYIFFPRGLAASEANLLYHSHHLHRRLPSTDEGRRLRGRTRSAPPCSHACLVSHSHGHPFCAAPRSSA